MRTSRFWTNIVFVAMFIAAAAITSTAQMKMPGQVVEVLDGKTVVVMVPTGRVKVELQGIDVPESEQALHDVVKDHVRTMLLGKPVELQTNGFTRETITGRLFMSGVDVSQQLLRDGAAWHLENDRSGQNKDQFASYAESELMARQEKRGVWSVAGLEPAWEFRAKKSEAAAAAAETITKPLRSATATPAAEAKTKPKGYWSDENPKLKDPGSLIHGYNAASKTGFLSTSPFEVFDLQTKLQVGKTTIDFTYVYTETGKGRNGYFVVTVCGSLNDPLFAKADTIGLHADGKRVVVKRIKREVENRDMVPMERSTYNVDKATFHKLVHGNEAYVALGQHNIRPLQGLPMLLYKMLQLAD